MREPQAGRPTGDRGWPYTAAMQQNRVGGVTWVLGTTAALIGLVLAFAADTDTRFVGGVLVVAGILLRIEAAVLGAGSGSRPAADATWRPPYARKIIS